MGRYEERLCVRKKGRALCACRFFGSWDGNFPLLEDFALNIFKNVRESFPRLFEEFLASEPDAPTGRHGGIPYRFELKIVVSRISGHLCSMKIFARLSSVYSPAVEREYGVVYALDPERLILFHPRTLESRFSEGQLPSSETECSILEEKYMRILPRILKLTKKPLTKQH